MEDFKKFWLKSKIVIVNLIVAVGSFIGIIIDNFGQLLTSNYEYLKTILPSNLMLIVMLLLGIYNIYLRFKTVHPITAKKDQVGEPLTPKEEVKKDETIS